MIERPPDVPGPVVVFDDGPVRRLGRVVPLDRPAEGRVAQVLRRRGKARTTAAGRGMAGGELKAQNLLRRVAHIGGLAERDAVNFDDGVGGGDQLEDVLHRRYRDRAEGCCVHSAHVETLLIICP